MLEIGEPAIKLFGKTIPVTGDEDESSHGSIDVDTSSNSSHQHQIEKNLGEGESMEIMQPGDTSSPAKEEVENPEEIPDGDENQETPDSEKCSDSPEDDEKGSNHADKSSQKPLKKPDKILPCPRCKSMDTKFCYYNNYNVNQPRHFCKSCQRYWTAGGTTRNVPVGAGRRKNKSSSSRYCHITVSEALQQASQFDIPNGLKNNGTVLSFGSDAPLCESMASALNLAEKKVLNVTPRNGFHNMDHDHSNGSMIPTNSMDESVKKGSQEPTKHNLNGFPNQPPCLQWAPYMWNPAVPAPPFYPSGFPMPFYPTPYWHGGIPWNMPWVTPCSPNSPSQIKPGSNPSSPLGKHSRDGEVFKPCGNEKTSGSTTVLVPKTLRIDDPEDAAKSSIWTTLGIKKGKSGPLSKGGFFNTFQSKDEESHERMEAPSMLKANPAALSRSVQFQGSDSP